MIRKLATVAAALVLSATALAADPIEGLWQTQPDDGAYAHVRITPCGAKFCGTIVRTFNASGEYQSPNIGKRIVRDFVPVGGGNYEGSVFRPSNGKTYIGKAAVSGNKMKLRGCVAGGLLCSKQDWRRVN